MSHNNAKIQEDHELEQNSNKSYSVLIGTEEFMQINLSNKLQNFDFQVRAQASIEDGINFLTRNKCAVAVVDIDYAEIESVLRMYKIVHHLQIPCMFIGTDPSFLNRLRLEMDSSFVTFLPKSILNSMFNESIQLLLKKTSAATKLSKRFIDVSTLDKPLSFYILATLLFCEPIIKVFYMKFQTGFEWEVLFRTIYSIEGLAANFEFWALFPLAGYALISVKFWSFFVFIALQAYSLYAYFTYEEFTWPYVAQTPHISSTLLIAINTLLVMYLAVPANRRPYWNQSRRIWRDTSRYATNIKAYLKIKDEQSPTTITNISETGAYLTSNKNLPIGHKMRLDIPVNGQMVTVDAIVRRSQDTAHNDYLGYGVEFSYNNRDDKEEMKEFISGLSHRIQ